MTIKNSYIPKVLRVNSEDKVILIKETLISLWEEGSTISMMEKEISVTNSQMVIKKITDDYLSESQIFKFENIQ